VRFVGVGEGHGHYLPESADALVAEKVVEFVKRGLEGVKL
jgi:creatinine amidohydrolase/Fe(II)-dependent formamide hydrolase-like protein